MTWKYTYVLVLLDRDSLGYDKQAAKLANLLNQKGGKVKT
jgi:hypothetical protein